MLPHEDMSELDVTAELHRTIDYHFLCHSVSVDSGVLCVFGKSIPRVIRKDITDCLHIC